MSKWRWVMDMDGFVASFLAQNRSPHKRWAVPTGSSRARAIRGPMDAKNEKMEVMTRWVYLGASKAWEGDRH